jgi:hypothetical protein
MKKPVTETLGFHFCEVVKIRNRQVGWAGEQREWMGTVDEELCFNGFSFGFTR